MLSRPLLKVFNQFFLGISLLMDLRVIAVGALRLMKLAHAVVVMNRAKLFY